MAKRICPYIVNLIMAVLICKPLSAQYYFGRNKIQYNQFNWHILKTEHFDIYYYPEMESLAEIGAAFAEESYSGLQDKFNHNVLVRIPLVFYSSHFHFEETNTLPYIIPQGLGGFFEFMKGRVVIPSDGSLSRFLHTIKHELVHVFQRSYVQRVFVDHGHLVMREIPLWFVEGLAEYWSEGWDSEAEMIIRDGVLNNTIVPIQQMGLIWGTYLMYKEGQAVLKYISDTFGDDKILKLLDNAWKSESFSEVMKITLGKDYKELDEEWLYHLKKIYYPLMEGNDSPDRITERYTDRGYNIASAFFRENGEAKVVFLANRDGYTSIYMQPMKDLFKEAPEVIIRGERTPDLEAFNMQRSRIDVDPRGRLAFIAKSGSSDILYIYSIPERELTGDFKFSELVSLFSPSWSPDGGKIALVGLDAAGRNDLYIFDLADKSLRRLTCDYFDDQDPDWSPDGQRLVFSSDRTRAGDDGHYNLFLYDTGDGNIRYLTYGACIDKNPSWSPLDETIVFSSDRNGVHNLWAVQAGTRSTLREEAGEFMVYSGTEMPELMQLTRFTTGAFYPAWTDSMDILFTAFENVGFHIRGLTDAGECFKGALTMEQGMDNRKQSMWNFPTVERMSRTTRVKYKRRFSLDFAQSQVVQDPIFGTSGGGQLGISDMLGDEQYYFLLYNNARIASEFWDGFNIAATRVDLSHRINFALGLYRLAGYYYNRYEQYFYERRYGGFFSVSYPFNRFERLETSVNIRHSDKAWFSSFEERKAMLVSNFISYTKDNSLWGPTGPLDGVRYNITLGNTVDLQFANVNFTTVMVDLRHYFRLGYRAAHAARIWGQFNQGKEPLPFVMGGSWDLRGYKLWSLWGTKLVLISNELRFPFLDQFYLGFPFGGIGFNSIRGALFLDAGNVWTDDFGEWKGSMGVGIRFRFAGFLVIRLDMGKKTDFKQIYPRTFTQLFFGWDF